MMAGRPLSFWLRAAISLVGGLTVGLTFAVLIVSLIATRFGDYNVVTVRSSSMEPDIARGDIVITRPASVSKVAQGDVILFKDQDSGVPFVHRVIATRQQVTRIVDQDDQLVSEHTAYFFVTQGDANEFPDAGDVNSNEYLGKYWFSIPTFGLLGSSISPTWIFLGIAGVSALLWGGYEIASRARGKSSAGKSGRSRGGRAIPTPLSTDRQASLSRPGVQVHRVRSRRFGNASLRRFATNRRLAVASGLGRAYHSVARRPAMAGSGLWVLLPAAVWLAAAAVIFGAGVKASTGSWTGETQMAGEAAVKIPKSPTPSPSASPSPSPSGSDGGGGGGSSCVEPTPAPTTGNTFDFFGRPNRGRTTQATPVATVCPASTPVPTATATASPSATATASPTATESPTATASATTTASPTASPPTATASPTASPTETPSPTSTQAPTASPTP